LSGYRSKFKKDWTKKWNCIVAVPQDQYSLKCTVCAKKLSCCHMGITDVNVDISEKNSPNSSCTNGKDIPTFMIREGLPNRRKGMRV